MFALWRTLHSFLANAPKRVWPDGRMARISTKDGGDGAPNRITIVALVVSSFSGILTIGALMKHLQRKGTGQYTVYRVVFAVGTMAVIWYRPRHG